MEGILNITNGDSAIKVMRDAAISGEFLPWRDVLHDGPVPADLSLEELSGIRAQFIAERGWGDLEEVKNSFRERDEKLGSFRNHEKVILWFEHDLYDQLQILQILDWFSHCLPQPTELSIICTEQYLGMASPEQMKDLLAYQEVVTQPQLTLAKKAWAAFRSTTPEKWQALLHDDTSILPFLQDAILRQLQEYPDCMNGLSLTALRALSLIAEGEKQPAKVFEQYQKTEQRRFMGDASFWSILQQLLDSTPPLLRLSHKERLFPPQANREQELSITVFGRQVLDGEKSCLDQCEIDRWIGGVHLTPVNLWCWNAVSQRSIKRA